MTRVVAGAPCMAMPWRSSVWGETLTLRIP